jgi:hypothetical protein
LRQITDRLIKTEFKIEKNWRNNRLHLKPITRAFFFIVMV